MKIKRALYLGYYLKELDREKFLRFINHVCQQTEKTRNEIIADILKSVFVHNISVLEYFQFGFYNLDEQQREQWAGTGFMYEYQLKMNPPDKRHILDDKRLFYKNYSDFMVHDVADVLDLKMNPALVETMLSNSSGKLVFKPADGKCGDQVEIRNCKEFNSTGLIAFMAANKYGIVEEFIEQHPHLNRLSPSAVNTVRIITQLNDNNEVDILGCRLRISVDSPVDNMAAGNLAAPINEHSGRVGGPAVYSDITKLDQVYHPVTSVEIPGFEIPFWEDALSIAKKAALLYPQNRSVGWDIVITENGPGLIEGNHDWCKLLWQLPVKKGLKSVLQRYLQGKSEEMVPAQV